MSSWPGATWAILGTLCCGLLAVGGFSRIIQEQRNRLRSAVWSAVCDAVCDAREGRKVKVLLYGVVVL